MNNLYPNTIGQVLFLLLIPFFLASPFFYLMMTMGLNYEEFSLINMLIYFILFLGLYIAISKIKKLPLVLDSHFVPTKNHSIGVFILLVISFQIGINSPMAKTISFFFNLNNENATPPSILVLMSIVLFGPLMEEIMFRGIILRGLLSKYTAKKAIIFTAILFGLIHMNPIQIPGAILLGIFFSWIYYRTRNIGICIMLHMVANTTTMLIQYIPPHLSFSIWYIYGVFTLVFVILTIQLYKKSKKNIF